MPGSKGVAGAGLTGVEVSRILLLGVKFQSITVSNVMLFADKRVQASAKVISFTMSNFHIRLMLFPDKPSKDKTTSDSLRRPGGPRGFRTRVHEPIRSRSRPLVTNPLTFCL